MTYWKLHINERDICLNCPLAECGMDCVEVTESNFELCPLRNGNAAAYQGKPRGVRPPVARHQVIETVRQIGQAVWGCAELARAADVTPQTVRRMLNEQMLVGKKLEGRWHITGLNEERIAIL